MKLKVVLTASAIYLGALDLGFMFVLMTVSFIVAGRASVRAPTETT